MLWACISLIILGAIGVVIYVWQKSKKYSVLSLLIKAVISFLFIIVALLATYEKQGHILNIFIIIGLILGFSGDIWLDLKFIYPKDDRLYTFAGFIVFGLGHLFFIIGMHLEFSTSLHILYIIIPILVALSGGIINLFLAKPLKLDFKDIKWMVFVYSVFLFATPFTAFSLLIAYSWSNTTLMMLFIGGVLFAISDLVLSNTYFGKDHEKPLDFILNYSTYFAAQYIIAFSLLFL